MPRLAGVLIAATAIALGGCQSASSPTPLDPLANDRPVIPVLHEVYTSFDEPARFTVRNARQWALAWTAAYVGRSDAPPRPDIDFDRDMVVVAAQGAQGSSGYDISIDRAAAEDGSVAVDVTTTSPGPNCFNLAVITSPVMMVRVPASDSPVRFIEHRRTRSCE